MDKFWLFPLLPPSSFSSPSYLMQDIFDGYPQESKGNDVLCAFKGAVMNTSGRGLDGGQSSSPGPRHLGGGEVWKIGFRAPASFGF